MENIGHPLLAGALREILEIAGYILPTMLIASNFAHWLRCRDETGNLLPWAVEQIQQERQQKERLAAYLLSQAIDPNNLPGVKVTYVTVLQITLFLMP